MTRLAGVAGLWGVFIVGVWVGWLVLFWVGRVDAVTDAWDGSCDSRGVVAEVREGGCVSGVVSAIGLGCTHPHAAWDEPLGTCIRLRLTSRFLGRQVTLVGTPPVASLRQGDLVQIRLGEPTDRPHWLILDGHHLDNWPEPYTWDGTLVRRWCPTCTTTDP